MVSCIVLLVVVFEIGEVLCVFVNGYGKCMFVDDFLIKKCGGKGVIVIKIFECNGELVGVVVIDEFKELMLIFDGGILVCICVFEVVRMGCNV